MYQLFKPSLHAQRHDFVVDFVRRNKPKKVVDLGCGECGLLGRLRFNHQIALLIGVDLNGAKLRKKITFERHCTGDPYKDFRYTDASFQWHDKHGLAPLSADYLQPTFDQLCVQLYQGSVTQKDARFRGFDLVTSIELALNVCSEFGYMVEFTGVGQAPPGQEQRIGFCTQIGVFHRLMVDRVGPMFGDNAENNYPYTLVYSVTYPSLCDDNILRRILVSELLFCAEKLKKEWLEKLTDKLEEVNAVEKDETGGECGEIFWSNCQEPQCHNLHRHVSVALQLLCTCCPKLRELSRSLSNLRRLIVDDPQIKMNRERSAVILCCLEQGDEEPNDLTDSGYAERSHVEEENWEITC
ncbi:small RNA 2'-O-methyltransferase isoform X4 [Syngnathoides biaculeatus]|uniref:small RNA 2'-O-methyltransferase isoform X4 n=1 Tax=Syngnathoides biaculeatus TaxID=300417 RepID=UPI002ADE01BB|nr:small RNA 2'-O-methyltransferase isoform X4 [Syngnathoides biaculeatus]